MALAAEGGSPNKPRKPRKPSTPTTYSNKFESLVSPVYSPTRAAPQQVYSASSPIKPKPGPYSVTETAWGPDYFKNSNQLRTTLYNLRRNMPEEDLNGFLSDLLTDRYDAFRDRLEGQYARQKAHYSSQLAQMLDRARAGQEFEVPKMPKVQGAPEPGQGVNSLLRTMNNQLKDAKTDEEKDAITKFYGYELTRLTGDAYNSGLLDEVRGQRSDLRTYYQNALAELRGVGSDASSDAAAETMDPDADYIQQQIQNAGKKKKGKKGGVGPVGPDFSGDPLAMLTGGWANMGAAKPNPNAPVVTANTVLASNADVIKEQHDAETEDGLFTKIWHNVSPLGMVADHTQGPVSDALNKVGDETNDVMMGALDKLTRPLYAVNNASKAFYEMDDDEGNLPGWLTAATGGSLSGKSFLESLDDINPENIKKVVTAAYRGERGKDKTLFSEIIKSNAEGNPEKSYWDNPIYQVAGGLAGDIASDPLNVVGVGLAVRPMTGLRSAEDVERFNGLTRLSEDVADELSKVSPVGSMHRPLDPPEILDLITGGLRDKLPHSTAHRKKALADIHTNVNYLVERLNKVPEAGMPEDLVKMSDLRDALQAQREASLSQFGHETLLQALRREFGIRESKGTVAPGTMEDIESVISAQQVAKHLPRAYALSKAQERIAASLGVGETRADALRDVVQDAGKKFQGNIEHLTGRKESLYEKDVKLADGSNSKSRIERTAWQNLQNRYDDLLTEHEGKVGTPRERADRAVKLEEMRKIISDGLNKSDYQSFRDLMPDALKHDPRFTEKDWEEVYGVSMRLAREIDPNYRKFVAQANSIRTGKVKNARAALETAHKSGDAKKIQWAESNLAAAERRLQFVENRRDIIQADVILKLLNQRIARGVGDDIFKGHKDLNAIKDETKALKEELKSLDGTAIDDQARIEEITQRLSDLKTERSNLRAVPAADRVKLDRVPETLAGKDGKISWHDLRSLVRFDSKTMLFKPVAEGKTAEEQAWLHSVSNKMQETYEEIYQIQRQKVYDKAKGEAKSRNLSESPKDWPEAARKQYYADLNRIEIEAGDRAFEQVLTGVNHHTLTVGDYGSKIETIAPITAESSEKDLRAAFAFREGRERAQLLEKQVAAKNANDGELVKNIDLQIKYLDSKYKEERRIFDAASEQSKAATALLKERMFEDALLRTAELGVSPMRKRLSLKVLSNDLAIPGSEALFKAAEVAGGIPGIRATKEIFAEAFRSPAARLTDEAALVRNRQVAHTPNIIEHHINHLKKTLGTIREYERVSAFRSMLYDNPNAYTGEGATQQAIRDGFKDLFPYFQNSVKVGDSTLSLKDINRYLPETFRLDLNYVRDRGGINTMQDLIGAITHGKGTRQADRGELKDPYRISWNLRVAVEQAQARKALEYTVYRAFGVRKVTGKSEEAKQLEGVFDKFRNRGWTEIQDLNPGYLFPPEIVPDIKRLLEMMEPRNIGAMGKLLDHATGYWKTATTVYNPGYWVRNGIGEVMSSWYAGVWSPKRYASAMDTIKYARRDGQELDALKEQFPMAKHIPSNSVPGSKVAFNLEDGTPITHEQVWVAYNDQGLKTGFFNTEFDSQYSRLGDKIRSSPAHGLADAHTKLRSAGEWYEDYLRMAHFHDAMIKSKAKTLQGAAEHAAKEVRKYHFDYTDFTNFEKTVMLRAFPFYKWTRKALPLMMTMLFTRPGKVLAYNKGMNASTQMSQAITTGDVSGDDNGFAPNYEGIVPAWMQDMWAYKIAEYSDNDSMAMDPRAEGPNESFLNIATPQMDIYKNLANPANAAYTLLNPAIKVPVEQLITNQPIGQLIGGSDFDTHYMDGENNDTGERIGELANQTPQTNFLDKLVRGDAKMEDILSFGSGLGIYQNNDARRMGALINDSD